ncbi:MAG: hypothetical protein VKJ24_06285 [Synechococcales bacterium]|nr:hypothetical protein [Synechococcales bacterium]
MLLNLLPSQPPSQPAPPGQVPPSHSSSTPTIRHHWFYLTLSLAVAAFYAGIVLREGFSSPWILQDDARVYLLWMERFRDPQLFPQDLMADYFQSVTPWGLGFLYRSMTSLDIDPLTLSKLLPLPISLLLAWYGYRLTVQLFPLAIAGFLSSVILLQSCWQRDDLASGAPRSFWALLLTAFLYYLARRAWLPLGLTVIAMGLFCPLAALLVSIFLILRWAIALWQTQTQAESNPNRSLLQTLLPVPQEIGALCIAIATLLPYIFRQSQFAPTITAAQAHLMPEFLPGGRLPFFGSNWFQHWFDGVDSGLQISFNPPWLALSLLLPWLMMQSSPWLKKVLRPLNADIRLLPQFTIAGLGGFFLAHALFAKIHFPSRYITHSFRVVMATAAGIVLAVGLQALLHWGLRSRQAWARPLALGGLGFGLVLLAVYPHLAWRNFPNTGYGLAENPALYQFLQNTPKTTLTAYLGIDGSNLPLLSKRSTLTAQEYAIPFHLGYYKEMRSRTEALLQAQYSPSLAPAQQLIRKYHIDYWLFDRNATDPNYLLNYRWMNLFKPQVQQIVARLKVGQLGAIAQIRKTCHNATFGNTEVLDAHCITQQ